jgi:hypothetical protein
MQPNQQLVPNTGRDHRNSVLYGVAAAVLCVLLGYLLAPSAGSTDSDAAGSAQSTSDNRRPFVTVDPPLDEPYYQPLPETVQWVIAQPAVTDYAYGGIQPLGTSLTANSQSWNHGSTYRCATNQNAIALSLDSVSNINGTEIYVQQALNNIKFDDAQAYVTLSFYGYNRELYWMLTHLAGIIVMTRDYNPNVHHDDRAVNMMHVPALKYTTDTFILQMNTMEFLSSGPNPDGHIGEVVLCMTA